MAAVNVKTIALLVAMLLASVTLLLPFTADAQIMLLDRADVDAILGSPRDVVLARLGRPTASGSGVRAQGTVEILRFRGMGFDRATATRYDLEIHLIDDQVREVFFLTDTSPKSAPRRR